MTAYDPKRTFNGTRTAAVLERKRIACIQCGNDFEPVSKAIYTLRLSLNKNIFGSQMAERKNEGPSHVNTKSFCLVRDHYCGRLFTERQ